ncbi:hypothetical protein GUJ93_ZPchr0012g21804 [Zizania palustris]|uniref:Uncharacterized protein n=1 Tax=Zizania palustris TaxID=103762 RepID=A0A8J6BRY5_ZIZPA|nr:hypothetical protein GUJ93_ZPchr0012g21804 [Zizania palustris]
MDEEEVEQIAVEEEMAERYSVPVEIFRAAGDVDCVRVSSIRGLEEARRLAAATDTKAVNIYLMPYLSPEDSLRIAQELEKPECSRLLVRNPELLTCKVAALEAMKAEAKREPIDSKQEHDGEHRLLVAKFRLHMENRLLIAHALRGNTLPALAFLKILHPLVYDTLPMDRRTGELGQQELLEILPDLQNEYPYSASEESDINELNQDLICILATLDWQDQLKVSGSLEFKGIQYRELMEEASLLGAANSTMTANALRRQLSSLMSSIVSKGLLGEDFCNSILNDYSIPTTRILIKSFCEQGDKYISELTELFLKQFTQDSVEAYIDIEKENTILLLWRLLSRKERRKERKHVDKQQPILGQLTELLKDARVDYNKVLNTAQEIDQLATL